MPKKPRSTMILTPLPSAGKLHHEVHSFLVHLRTMYAELDVPFAEVCIAGFDQPQCRAELLAVYYKHRHQYEDAIFLDSDTVVSPQLILELATLEEPLVCVPYEQRRREDGQYPEGSIAHWAVDTAGMNASVEIREGRRMMNVRGAGLGCTRIRREAVEHLWKKAREEDAFPCAFPAPFWSSQYPGLEGTEVCGLFEPIVHEHIAGTGVMRRRPDDMSFFLRCQQWGVQAWALCDAAIWHDGKGGVSLWDALVTKERELAAMRKRVDFELVDCPDNLLGLHEVLDGAYDIAGLTLEPGDRILDLGANIGAFAVWAARRFPGTVIECYEPEPTNFARLVQNTSILSSYSVTTHRVAVVGHSGEFTKLAPGRYNDGEWSTHVDDPNHDAARAIVVQSIPASGLAPCALLKVDTEGCEREILESYRHLESCKAVMLEWHSHEDYVWMMRFMSQKGFIPMVDRARGRPLPDRELCFLHRSYLETGNDNDDRPQPNGSAEAHAA